MGGGRFIKSWIVNNIALIDDSKDWEDEKNKEGDDEKEKRKKMMKKNND